ncbi:single-stranded-DNA-specific exonuclease RecJ [Thalassotalea castellviae]|uniref:Single-stranded-DNA-specific exonuclease RecJ n=1 Tax=Thalassotalea castellviae TaxID=3075612 RepID=A0ABU3A0F6_9GAMM|nr:single-stranded-DNA-specific exonuclease RecJ [Thalassotalea sp. W431]MDT0603656.1 single-stranded-DNA-specific exonuclease RecJ [Thalassotalea sp. W431]
MNKVIVRREKVDDSFLPASLHPVIKQIYASRGVQSSNELTLKANQLISVEQLAGIHDACTILYQAMVANQTIVIVGDFDADGATSTALMMTALSMFGYTNHQFLVPNRFEYGYGLTPEIVNIAYQQGAELLITVDSGISCIAGVEKAKSLGLKVIVTDHHLQGKSLPPADAIINPNQHQCSFPSKALAGVGVAFYFMLAMRKYLREQNWFFSHENNAQPESSQDADLSENQSLQNDVNNHDSSNQFNTSKPKITEPNIAQLLDLVALGTVADVVSLDANNRILVEQGLKRIRAGHTRPGIQALIEIAGKNQQRLMASDFGFALGPRINAAGRLDDMAYGINCLLAADLMSARVMAAELDSLNKSRREIEQGMQYEAETIMKQLNFTEENLPYAISLFNEQWHQGVIGIVAGRLKEKFHRPSIVFAQSDNGLELKGSARSIPGLHIRDLLEHIDSQHPGLIAKFGGHAMAAGLTILKENFALFQQHFHDYAKQWLDHDLLEGKVYSDGSLSLTEMTLDFAEKIRHAGPWGQNFLEPVFDDEFTLIQQRIVGEKHLKMVVEKQGQVFDAIAFNINVKQWPNHNASRVYLCYRLDINEFRGKQSLQLMVEYLTLSA